MKKEQVLIIAGSILLCSCIRNIDTADNQSAVHRDTPFLQDYSVKYYCPDKEASLLKVYSDRNGYVQVLSSKGLMSLSSGKFLFPGTIEKDSHYRPLTGKKISSAGLYQNQLVYLDDKAVLSNAWAGKIYLKHNLPEASIFEGGSDFNFLVSDGRNLEYINDSALVWESTINDDIKDIRYDRSSNKFWILEKGGLSTFNPKTGGIEKVLANDSLTCIAFSGKNLIAGTSDGYFIFDTSLNKQSGGMFRKMPWPGLTSICNINGKLWFGSTWGAMMLRDDGRFNYYASERWLPSDTVVHISAGQGNTVLILTTSGLARICFDSITLYDKAMYFEKQVRERHIRNGFNATISAMKKGDVTTGILEDSDNDGLWTSMYLAAEAFRYEVTGSVDALQNVRESLDAMERLYTITPVPGFPARSFERRGYKYDDKPWRRADDPEWDWKSTTSSDEAIGHIFAFGVIAELINEPEIRNKAIMLIDTLMSHVLKNNFYLIDFDGKPTRWGRWNPEYVNGFPGMIGDRKLNSSNIISMLQTAYRFTGKKKYRDAAFTLMTEHGYLKNMMKPFREIGVSQGNADELSRLLSEGWNHSDDEMYYCGYWGLYRYALNDTLRAKYRESIIDHWEAERPEKEGLWNIMTAITGAGNIDLREAVWYLQEYPVDLIEWRIRNSQRKDIVHVKPGFRDQTTTEVLPPDELRIARHNANRFELDGNDGGTSEMSAGDIWLLPYWIGRYLGVITGPVKEK